MEVESLGALTAGFVEWRRNKRHPREAVPQGLLARARRAIRVHGLGPVARATKIDAGRLKRGGGGGPKVEGGDATTAAMVPSFSRVDLAAPGATARPFAELETVAGVKVRFFAPTDETLRLLSSLCNAGGAR